MEGLGINLGYLLVQFLGIAILLILMYQFAYGPITRLLEQRQARIAKGLEDARQAAIARENADAEARRVLDEARAEAARIRAEASVQAEEQAGGITSRANAEARSIVAKGREDAEAERNRVLADMRGQIAAISIAAANKLVGAALDENRQRALVQEFFARVPAGVTELRGVSAEVTSALPLTESEMARVRQTIQVQDVQFKVDPDILGGLVVRVGDQVVDDSVATQMSALRESLMR
jgi:F-type H+-transporting ATPase subunit b